MIIKFWAIVCLLLSYFAFLGFWYTTQGHDLTQRIIGMGMLFICPFPLLQPYYLKACFRNKPVVLYNLSCVLLGCWGLNLVSFKYYEKKIFWSRLPAAALECLAVVKLYGEVLSSDQSIRKSPAHMREALCFCFYLEDCCPLPMLLPTSAST